jgi:hypothetical protein
MLGQQTRLRPQPLSQFLRRPPSRWARESVLPPAVSSQIASPLRNARWLADLLRPTPALADQTVGAQPRRGPTVRSCARLAVTEQSMCHHGLSAVRAMLAPGP